MVKVRTSPVCLLAEMVTVPELRVVLSKSDTVTALSITLAPALALIVVVPAEAVTTGA